MQHPASLLGPQWLDHRIHATALAAEINSAPGSRREAAPPRYSAILSEAFSKSPTCANVPIIIADDRLHSTEARPNEELEPPRYARRKYFRVATPTPPSSHSPPRPTAPTLASNYRRACDCRRSRCGTRHADCNGCTADEIASRSLSTGCPPVLLTGSGHHNRTIRLDPAAVNPAILPNRRFVLTFRLGPLQRRFFTGAMR
jgi:hypothetical protein